MNELTSTFAPVDCPDTANTDMLLKIYSFTFETKKFNSLKLRQNARVQVGKLLNLRGEKQFLKVKL